MTEKEVSSVNLLGRTDCGGVPDGATHMRRPEYITAWLFDGVSTMPLRLIEKYRSQPLPEHRKGQYATSVDGELWRWFNADKFEQMFAPLPPTLNSGADREAIARIIARELGENFDRLPDLHFNSGFCQDDFYRCADALSLPRAVDGGAADNKLALFLSILAAAGGETSGNDEKWNWINYFCDDAEPLDTFNQASKQKLTRVTHDSDTDNSVVYLTDAGRAFIATLPRVSTGGAAVSPDTDCEMAFIEACDEAGCAYDNESLLEAIAKLKLTASEASGTGDLAAWQARDKVRGGAWLNVPYPRGNPDFEYRPLYAVPLPLGAVGLDWQPIETAPKDGSFFQVWVPGLEEQGFIPIVSAYWDVENNELAGARTTSLEELEATHWMPLPAGPAHSRSEG